MIASNELPRTIRASVGPKVLSKVDELFRQDLSTIVHELAQNSRRAGTKRLEIAVTPLTEKSCEISIFDNGEGMENPEKLLVFGDSDWDLSIDARENAAGMGFASLASRGCTVISHDWHVRITPDAFTGKDDAIVTRIKATLHGMRVDFVEDSSAQSACNLIQTALRYYPLPVILNGKEIEREDFLKNSLYTREVLGVRIGIKCGVEERQNILNFYGLQVHGESLASLRFPIGKSYMNELYAVADIIDAPELRLVLPTRHAVIKNEFYDRLKAAARKTIFEYCATIPKILAYKDFAEAKSLGIAMPDPVPALRTWNPTSADGSFLKYGAGQITTLPENTDAVAVISYLNTLHAVNLQDVEDTNLVQFFESTDAFEGYAWYDALPRLSSLRYEALNDGAVTVAEADEDDEEFELPQQADSLRMILHITRCDDKTTSLVFDTDALARGGDVWNNPAFSFATSSKPGVDDIVDLIMQAGFCPSDDFEADSPETQERYAREELRSIVMTVLFSKEDAAADDIIEKDRDMRLAMRSGEIGKITITTAKTVIEFTNGTTKTIEHPV